MRLALVAIRLWWLMVSSVNVSMSWASMAGARTVTTGSRGKMGVPSGMAQMSPVNRKSARKDKNSSQNSPFSRRNRISSGEKCRFSIYSMNCPRPAQMAKPPLSGTFRKNTSK
jgi:hypothetical protein